MDSNWLTVANLLGLTASVGVNIWLVMLTRSDSRWTKLTERIEHVDRTTQTALSMHHARLAVLETTLSSLPTQDDLTEIRKNLSHIDRSVAALDERSDSTLVAVQRIECFLLGNKG